MSEPIFIELVDYNSNVFSINIKHIFAISEYQHPVGKDIITSVSYYHVPDCKNCGTTTLRTPERKESILNKIRVLSSKENNL